MANPGLGGLPNQLIHHNLVLIRVITHAGFIYISTLTCRARSSAKTLHPLLPRYGGARERESGTSDGSRSAGAKSDGICRQANNVRNLWNVVPVFGGGTGLLSGQRFQKRTQALQGMQSEALAGKTSAAGNGGHLRPMRSGYERALHTDSQCAGLLSRLLQDSREGGTRQKRRGPSGCWI